MAGREVVGLRWGKYCELAGAVVGYRAAAKPRQIRSSSS